MLIPPRELKQKFFVSPSGVLHVGAHEGEEAAAYRQQNFGRVIWVEAQPHLVDALRKQSLFSNDTVIEAAVWGSTGLSKTFRITNNGQSSSLYELAEHSRHYPSIVQVDTLEVSTVRLDEIIPEGAKFDFVNLDVQGAELEALVGLGEMLNQVVWIYSEVNKEELYSGIPLVTELDNFLKKAGFARICTSWTTLGWGDALYVRRTFSLRFLLLRFRGVLFNLTPVFRSLLRKIRLKCVDPLYRFLRFRSLNKANVKDRFKTPR